MKVVFSKIWKEYNCDMQVITFNNPAKNHRHCICFSLYVFCWLSRLVVIYLALDYLFKRQNKISRFPLVALPPCISLKLSLRFSGVSGCKGTCAGWLEEVAVRLCIYSSSLISCFKKTTWGCSQSVEPLEPLTSTRSWSCTRSNNQELHTIWNPMLLFWSGQFAQVHFAGIPRHPHFNDGCPLLVDTGTATLKECNNSHKKLKGSKERLKCKTAYTQQRKLGK